MKYKIIICLIDSTILLIALIAFTVTKELQYLGLLNFFGFMLRISYMGLKK